MSQQPQDPGRTPPSTPPQWQRQQPPYRQQRHYQPPQPPPYGPPPSYAPPSPQPPRKSRKGLVGLGCGGSAALFILIAVLASSSPSSSAPPASAPQSSAPASAGGGCKLKTTFDYLVRTTEPGLKPQAQEIGNVDLADCTGTLSGFRATAGQAAGECTTIAKASDNPGYDANAVPAPPLRAVIEKAGPGC